MDGCGKMINMLYQDPLPRNGGPFCGNKSLQIRSIVSHHAFERILTITGIVLTLGGAPYSMRIWRFLSP
jgi:hypothetical protein